MSAEQGDSFSIFSSVRRIRILVELDRITELDRIVNRTFGNGSKISIWLNEFATNNYSRLIALLLYTLIILTIFFFKACCTVLLHIDSQFR